MILPPVLSEFDKKSDQKLPSVQCEYDFVSKKKLDCWRFKKPKIDHNSFNNGVRAILKAFLDFYFFKASLN